MRTGARARRNALVFAVLAAGARLTGDGREAISGRERLKGRRADEADVVEVIEDDGEAAAKRAADSRDTARLELGRVLEVHEQACAARRPRPALERRPRSRALRTGAASGARSGARLDRLEGAWILLAGPTACCEV